MVRLLGCCAHMQVMVEYWINLINAFGYEYDAVIAYNGSGTGEL